MAALTTLNITEKNAFLLWLIFTLLLSSTVIGLVISVSDEWQEMGDKIIDKL